MKLNDRVKIGQAVGCEADRKRDCAWCNQCNEGVANTCYKTCSQPVE
jgi:hypothetical protein